LAGISWECQQKAYHFFCGEENPVFARDGGETKKIFKEENGRPISTLKKHV
jgi:hypothetical protein